MVKNVFSSSFSRKEPKCWAQGKQIVATDFIYANRIFQVRLAAKIMRQFVARTGRVIAGTMMIVVWGTLHSAGHTPSSFPEITNSQEEHIPFLTPKEALERVQVPPGFRVTLFASEPHVQQPIGMTFDARGRLWVAENYTYADRTLNFDSNLRDRIVILEDTDGDGQFDKRTVFWDGAQKLTSVALGFGGVFAMCPPGLLFIPDRDGDDVPDGEPEVLLDGWDDGAVRHNIANGLKWGPDGWLYGRHGILASSFVGAPGTPRDQRMALNCAIWRYHPITRAFEVVAHGTTNPWGHDWDDHGQLFFINTVIGHLWHVLPGAYYKRMYGEHFNPRLYELIDQVADHVHWDTRESWDDIRKGVTASTVQAGGGHAHSGFMIYLGDNWPADYRNGTFTLNFHGRRINHDRLERRGAGYVGLHEPDLMSSEDPWFRGIELLYGPDGGVYVADWSDIGECHENDGVHRTSGRIYKIVYGERAGREVPGGMNLARLSNAELVGLQLHRNDWFVREARRILYERAAGGAEMKDVHAALREIFERRPELTRKLRALWALHLTGGADQEWLVRQLGHPEEHVRVWAVQLLADQRPISDAIASEFVRLARAEESGLVLSFLASALQRLPIEKRLELASVIVSRSEFGADPVLPLMVWYGVEPAVPAQASTAIALAEKSRMPRVREFIARRVTEQIESSPQGVEALTELLARRMEPEFQRDILRGMTDALRGWQKASQPKAWEKAAAALERSSNETVRKWARELAVVFGDGRAVDELRALVRNKNADLNARRRALQALVQSRAEDLLPLLEQLLREQDMAPDAVRAFAALGDPSTPEILLDAWRSLYWAPARMEVINTLASRPSFARALLEAIEKGTIRPQEVGPLQIRQLRNLPDPEVARRMARFWPEVNPLSEEKRREFARYKEMLQPEKLAEASASRGRQVYSQACGSCHVLFGEGGQIGPDLTGSDRKNLDYLLDKILEPSAIVPEDYRVSVITLKDDRVITGILGAKTERTVAVKTPTETLTLERSAIDDIQQSDISLMPEGLLQGLSDAELRDLMAYLTSPGPVR
jgi:putative membrane-bound dehydrogenase-like protein